MLRLLGDRPIPPRRAGAFDHGDVHLPSGRVFVTHTSDGTVEVLDPWPGKHRVSIPGCPEGSGLLCLPDRDEVVAASRATGRVVVISATTFKVLRTVQVGAKPNGLAWDPGHQRLLVADVGPNPSARLVDLSAGKVEHEVPLPGRPRWCLYDSLSSSFLLNIREPSALLSLRSMDLATASSTPIPAEGPHGLAIDAQARRAFVAADDAQLVVLSLATSQVERTLPLTGPPDVVWHDLRTHRLYVAVGEPGKVDVFDTLTFKRVDTVDTQRGCHTSAIDPKRGYFYAFLPQQSALQVFSTADGPRGGP
ncbi:MAG: YncE family protein [Euryarchaeota archaeon]|nr:YncE family protein [Euryarchaeota archaeon]MDE1837834.1 YncE family protein [Euryarchaeota archaeon]MDE1880108.1 YncE family protein [Euryarchaeota archaeon]